GDAHSQENDRAFELELVDTGITLTVPAGRTALDVVEDAGVFVLSSCREGNCGTCETPVLTGEIDHRDVVLSPGEKARNSCMMLCVSGGARGTSNVRTKLRQKTRKKKKQVSGTSTRPSTADEFYRNFDHYNIPLGPDGTPFEFLNSFRDAVAAEDRWVSWC